MLVNQTVVFWFDLYQSYVSRVWGAYNKCCKNYNKCCKTYAKTIYQNAG